MQSARFAALALAVLAGLLIAGCGGDEATTTSADATTATSATASGATGATSAPDEDVGVVSNTVEVTITDDAIQPSNADPGSLLPGETITSTATAGEVIFELINEASQARSIIFNESGKEIPLAEDLAPGDTTTVTLELTSGFYVYYDADEGPGEQNAQLEVVD